MSSAILSSLDSNTPSRTQYRRSFGISWVIALASASVLVACGSSSEEAGGAGSQNFVPTGGSSSGGNSGSGGSSGSGQSGNGGQGGSSTAGNAGTAGSSAGTAGVGGNAGTAGVAGTAGNAGTAGTADCGQNGQMCCSGNACSSPSDTCVNGLCTHCGAELEPCCGNFCDSGFSCSNGTCQCGNTGEVCCQGSICFNDNACIDSYCNCASSCDPDGVTVRDCHGNAIQTCTGTEECIAGVCSDPCAIDTPSSYGCNFYALRTSAIDEATGACFAVFVANTWTSPVHINVEFQGQQLDTASFTRIPSGQGSGLTYSAFDATAGLAPGEVALVFLSRSDGLLPACPAPAAVGDVSVPSSGLGNAFHITTDRPVTMYQMLPYGGGSAAATSATLLLPVNTWAKTYVAVNAYAKSQIVAQAQPSLDILAQEDATTVTITSTVNVVGGNGAPSGSTQVPFQVVLNKGQYVQFNQDQELTGSKVQADKPIGMWGGATCLNVPVNTYACDTAQQQIPPLIALGNRYVGLRYRGRAGTDEAVPWRLVGTTDGTVLNWTPSTPPGAPTTINEGQVAEFSAPGPFVVESQDTSHPFYAAGYMTGGENFNGEGDPEWVNLVPSDQYLSRYVFFTDPTYSETELEVVRAKGADGQFADVTLDCLGTLSGWQPIGQYEYTRVPLVTGNFSDVGGCSNGRHEMNSANPFGVTVWGWGSTAASFFTQYVSYAYPAGVAVKKINDKEE